MSATRKRRLRKKLRVDEFQQLGLKLHFTLADSLSVEQEDTFWWAFIDDAIEAHRLLFVGNARGFVFPEGRASATEAEAETVRQWLVARPEISSVTVGPFLDAWYTDVL